MAGKEPTTPRSQTSSGIQKVELSKVGSPEEILEALSVQGRRLLQTIEAACNGSRKEVFETGLEELKTVLVTVANLAEILRLTGALQRLPAEVSSLEKPTRKCEVAIRTFREFPFNELGFQEWAYVRTSLIDLQTLVERFLELNLDLK